MRNGTDRLPRLRSFCWRRIPEIELRPISTGSACAELDVKFVRAGDTQPMLVQRVRVLRSRTNAHTSATFRQNRGVQASPGAAAMMQIRLYQIVQGARDLLIYWRARVTRTIDANPPLFRCSAREKWGSRRSL